MTYLLSGYATLARNGYTTQQVLHFVDVTETAFGLYRSDNNTTRLIFEGSFEDCEAIFLQHVS